MRTHACLRHALCQALPCIRFRAEISLRAFALPRLFPSPPRLALSLFVSIDLR
jgi:hypothetical protein